MTMQQGQAEFHARVKRIDSRMAKGRDARLWPPDLAKEMNKPKNQKAMRGVRHTPKWIEGLNYLLGLPVNLVLGAAAVLLARFLVFLYMGDPASAMPDVNMGLAMDVGLALAVLVTLRLVMGGGKHKYLVSKAVGMAAAALLLHNSVHSDPDLWAQAFSQEWVSKVQATTQADTVYIMRGMSFPLG